MKIASRVRASHLRVALLGSAATMSLIVGGTAHAADGVNPAMHVTHEAQGGGAPSVAIHEAQAGAGAPDGMYNEVQSSVPTPSIAISDPGTPTTAIDPQNVNGVGQMVIDEENGFIGLCTGTLINPRTVIFAAHCVGENPAGTGFQDPWDYGTANGGLPISFGFSNNNLPALRNWFASGYQTNVADYLYNVNQVKYNPDATLLGPDGIFLQGDVALASLDTPAANVPTWAILLSQLPQIDTINPVTGTGYHVTITGYGNNGTGTAGATGGIDFRRRVAENYVGLLGSLDDVDLLLFGSPDGLPQNLYQLDFDDPTRTNPYDFNVLKDDALPHEGITGAGDSGGPLILDDTYDNPVVIGVLSGGDSFYKDQPSGGYGTSSFYQPLYLFWQYIVANNPYHYVSANAGDGNWEDPTHWVSNLDPAYQVLVDNRLANGVPTSLGAGLNGVDGKFGDICFEQGDYSECYNIATGIETFNGTESRFAPPSPAAGEGDAVPAATLANGLPGATGFVPDNNDPDRATMTDGRYFDVTLSATGTTTLSSAVTIDRFTINGAGAALTVAAAGSLTSNIDFTQLDGLVTDNGTINVAGDYFLMSGGLQGAGRINTPFLTSAVGFISPGTTGTIATLTFGGNLILTSGNHYLVDIGNSGASDRIAVVATTDVDAAGNPTSGIASIGGFVGFAPATGQTPRAGQTYTILTAENGVEGTFDTPTALSAILTPRFIYNATSVQVTLDAGLYANVVSAGSPVQSAYAQLLDQNRALGNYDRVSDVFGYLDLQSAATIRGTLETLAPRTETTRNALATVALDNMARFYRERVGGLSTDGLDGSLAVIGRPFEVAANNLSAMPGTQAVRTDAGTGMVEEHRLPAGVSGFIAGGYLDGHSRPMPTATPYYGRDEFDGFYVAGGIETEVGPHAVVGFGLSYTNVNGQPAAPGQDANGDLYQGTMYGKVRTATGVVLDAVGSAGVFDSRTVRNVALGATPYRLTSNDRSLALSGEIGVGKAFDYGMLTITPRAAMRVSTVLFDQINEQGGGPALRIDRDHVDSYQTRAGLNITAHGPFRPYLSAYYVHDIASQPGVFGANFAGGVGPNAIFAVAGHDKNWGEASVGIGYHTGRIDLSVSADTTFLRSDVTNQAYRGAVTFHF